ncbi:MAG: hypothetical protein KBA51_04140 [Kiritimatiellae bacterium]|nr:hypothetical protein [Kiritimatiellia bacterium]
MDMTQVGGRNLHPEGVNFRVEQEATLARPRMKYTLMARFFFSFMNLIYGKTLTVPKIKLIEILARIPYQAWELKAYWQLSFGYYDERIRSEAVHLVHLGRLSQDNEFWHLVIAVEKIREDQIKESGFWFYFMPKVMAVFYAVFARTLAVFHLKSAYYFNAMFEDHAEHEYARFVQEHPELDQQPVKSELVKQFGPYPTWGDVFRRIGLDERIHMNESLQGCGRGGEVVPYASLPKPS